MAPRQDKLNKEKYFWISGFKKRKNNKIGR